MFQLDLVKLDKKNDFDQTAMYKDLIMLIHIDTTIFVRLTRNGWNSIKFEIFYIPEKVWTQ